MNVEVVPEYVTVPETALLLLSFNVNAVVVIVDESIDSENVAVSAELIATPVELLAGLTAVIVGAVVSDVVVVGGVVVVVGVVVVAVAPPIVVPPEDAGVLGAEEQPLKKAMDNELMRKKKVISDEQ